MTVQNTSAASPHLLRSCAVAAVVGALLVGAATSGPANLNLSLSVQTGRSFLHVELGNGSPAVSPAPTAESAAHAH